LYVKMGIVGRMSALLTIDGVRTISLTVPPVVVFKGDVNQINS